MNLIVSISCCIIDFVLYIVDEFLGFYSLKCIIDVMCIWCMLVMYFDRLIKFDYFKSCDQ